MDAWARTDRVNDQDKEWARSYASQALSDLQARDLLARAKSHKCHRLYFLQMAAEKACKAHLTSNNGHEHVRKTHAYIERNLPIIARLFYARTNRDNVIRGWELDEIRRLAREIQVLSPACDDGDTRRDNTEYPWEDASGQVRTPCQYNFPSIDEGSRGMIRLIRLIRTAAESYNAK